MHVWGRPAPVTALEDLARRHDLTLLFDAAHAFDCTSGGVPIGGNGLAEVFSFHATKFFNTFEGGAIVTNDDDLAQRARLMRNFGFSGYDNVIHPGTNGKMTEICAAMGLVNLEDLDDVVVGNRRTYGQYAAALSMIEGVDLLSFDPRERMNHQYVVAMVTGGAHVRDAALDALHDRGILARKYFWPGVHRMEPYRSTPSPSATLSGTAWVTDRVLVLPGGPSITTAQVESVASVLTEVLAGCRPDLDTPHEESG